MELKRTPPDGTAEDYRQALRSVPGVTFTEQGGWFREKAFTISGTPEAIEAAAGKLDAIDAEYVSGAAW